MPSSNSDRNLLFGILALQMDLICRDDLIKAMNGWVLNKEQSLGSILVKNDALSPSDRDLLEQMVSRHVEVHEGDPEKSLAALSSVDSIKQSLEEIHATEIVESLTHLSVATDAQDADATVSRVPGASVGQQSALDARFRIIRPHAEGGLGKVSVAVDSELNREVALKEIKGALAYDDTARSRFMQEAEITGGLEHPGIVPVYGLGHRDDGQPFYAMRFIKGDSLKDACFKYHAGKDNRSASENALEFRKLLGRFIDVCNAIEYAHSRGVLHRDLKPGNIMLGKYGETLVVDWGLAKAIGRDVIYKDLDEQTLQPSSTDSTPATRMGSALGTPHFMSPEQAAGKLDELGPGSDVYSLGATLYYLLANRTPFTERNIDLVLAKVQLGEFDKPREVDSSAPRALEAICLRAMAVEKADRYQTPKDLADDIDRWLADEPTLAGKEPITTKAKRWIRKHPKSVASMLATILIGLTALGVISSIISQSNRTISDARTEASEAKDAEAIAKDLADRRLQDADEATSNANMAILAANEANKLAEWRKYAYSVKQAQIEFMYGDELQAMQHLELNDPRFRNWEHNYLFTNFTAGKKQLPGHSDEIKALAFSPNGKLLASAGDDQTIQILDIETNEVSERLESTHGDVHCVSFSADSKHMVAGFDDGYVVVFDMQSNLEVNTYQAHQGPVLCADFSPDGNEIATGGRDPDVLIWNLAEMRPRHRLNGHTGAFQGFLSGVTDIDYSSDGKHFVSSGPSLSDIIVWESATGMVTRKLDTQLADDPIPGFNQNACFFPDDSRIASVGGARSSIRIWNLDKDSSPIELRYEKAGFRNMKVLPDGDHVVVLTDKNALELWDINEGRVVRTIFQHSSDIRSVELFPDGRRVALGMVNGDIQAWSLEPSDGSLVIRSKGGSVNSVTFSRDGRFLAFGCDDSSISVFDCIESQEFCKLQGHQGRVFGIDFSPSGKHLVSTSRDGTLRIWNVENAEEVRVIRPNEGPSYSAKYSPDGELILTGHESNKIAIWDSESGDQVKSWGLGDTGTVMQVGWSPDGQFAVSGGFEGRAAVWDAETGAKRFDLVDDRYSGPVNSVGFSPDSQTIATTAGDKICLWNAKTGEKLTELHGHSDLIHSLAYSQDSKRIFSGGYDKTVRVWSVEMGSDAIIALRGHFSLVVALAISPTGDRLATAAEDQTVRIWDASRSINPVETLYRQFRDRETTRSRDPDAEPAREPDLGEQLPSPSQPRR